MWIVKTHMLRLPNNIYRCGGDHRSPNVWGFSRSYNGTAVHTKFRVYDSLIGRQRRPSRRTASRPDCGSALESLLEPVRRTHDPRIVDV